MIAIGAQTGGPEHEDAPIRLLISKAMNAAAETRHENYDNGELAWINPIFIVPGSLLKPDFEGYKLGFFSRKRKGLVVMIAVPQQVADGRDIPEFIVTALREAAKLAEAYFTKKSVLFSPAEAERVIAAIDASLPKQTRH